MRKAVAGFDGEWLVHSLPLWEVGRGATLPQAIAQLASRLPAERPTPPPLVDAFRAGRPYLAAPYGWIVRVATSLPDSRELL